MPESIPSYRTAMALGDLADARALDLLHQVHTHQTKIDAARDRLNSRMALKRSLAMTVNELVELGVDATTFQEELRGLDASITASATDYLTARVEHEKRIQELEEKLSELEPPDGLESPIDFGASELKQLPLSSESLKLDSQFFTFGEQAQNDTMANIERFIRSSTKPLGNQGEEMARTVTAQVDKQLQHHGISGTLILTASCTHRLVDVFEPLVIDPDKAITAWNARCGAEDRIDTERLRLPSRERATAADGAPASLPLIVGASYGSSFVGMVHVLRSESARTGDIDAWKTRLESRLRVGGWLQAATGGFGVGEGALKEVKALLADQSISAHVGVVVMGALPSIAANSVATGMSLLAEVDNREEKAIRGLAASGEGSESTVASEAEKAVASARLMNMQQAKMSSLLGALSKIDREGNKMLDINSLLHAFEDYIRAISGASPSRIVGVPIHWRVKKLTKADILALWRKKHAVEAAALRESSR
jgi:hypothetical protein